MKYIVPQRTGLTWTREAGLELQTAFTIAALGLFIVTLLGCGSRDAAPAADGVAAGVTPGAAEAAVIWDDSEEAGSENLVLEPLRIQDADFEAPSVPVVTGSAHTEHESAFLLEEPWTIRGHLGGQETHFLELRSEGQAQLWHVEAAGENLTWLRYLDAGGGVQQRRNSDRVTGVAVMTSLFLPPGSHWFAVRAASDATDYTFRAVPLGPPDPHAEREPNDDATQAHRMTFGFPRTGHLYEAGDVDVYRFSLGAREHLALKVEPPADLSVRMDLHKAFGPRGTHRLIVGRSLAPGDTLVYQTVLPAGDYLVELQGDGATSQSEHPYTLRLERRNLFDVPLDLEPNDSPEHARPLPSDLVVSGKVGQFGGQDWFEMPALGEETHLTIEVVEEPGRFGVSIHEDGSTRDSRLLQQDRETGLYHATLQPETPFHLRVAGRGAYHLNLTFDPGPLPQAAPEPLAVDISFGASPTVCAAYWPQAQRLEVPVQLANREEAAVELQLEAISSNLDWSPEVSQTSVTLGRGEEISIPMGVRIRPDMRSDEPVRITVRAQNGEGLHTTGVHRLVARCGATPQAPEAYWALPPALLGGLNVAWTALGAEPVVPPSELRRVLPLFDGYTPIDDGWERPASELPVEHTVRLAGDGPVTVAGVALHPLARGLHPDHQPRDFDVLVSDDGESFREVFSGQMDRRTIEQAFVFDEPVSARYARLRIRTNHLGTDGRIGMGQWKVIAAPGESLRPGQPVNVAAADLGAHVVWADPTPSSYRVLADILTEGGRGNAIVLEESQPMRWVLSLHQQRAAQITELQWVDEPDRTFGDLLENVTVAISMDSPLGPWTELGHWRLERTADGVTPFALPEPVWARYVLFTSTDPDERGRWQYPQTLRVLERPADATYRSILGEWGHYSREAVYELLEPQEPAPFLVATGEYQTRERARRLLAGEAFSGAVQIGEAEDWHRIDVPSGENLLSLRLRGEPNLRIDAVLENQEGTAVSLERDQISPRELVLRAEVEPGATYYLRIYEPPRSFVFAWDNSGSMGPYRATVYQALQQFVGEVRPGMEFANFLPFQMGTPALLHPGWSDQSYLLQSTLTNYHRQDASSDAEPALLAATQELADRPGARAIILLTDAETFGFRSSQELWRAMSDVRPQIFSVEMHSGQSPPYHQRLMQSWASVNAGHYSQFGTQAEVDMAFDRAACYLRRPAHYAVTATTSYEAPPEPEMYDILMEEGRVVTHGIFFDIDSDRLRSESYPVLRQIGEMLQEHAELRLLIEGHTDNTGSAAWNQGLSERRAASVRSFLMERYGVDEARLESIGYGEDRPADTNDTPQGRQNNRRVELVRLEATAGAATS